LKAIFPMVSANDLYRDTSFMGGLIDFEFDETYLGLTAGTNTANPIGDTASDPTLLSDLAGIEADHANGLANYHAAQTVNVLTGGRSGLRRVLLAGAQPGAAPDRLQPDPGLPDRRRVRHLPARRADQLRRAAERLGSPERDRADAAPTRFYLGAGDTITRTAPPRTATSDTITWSPVGGVCGRPIDQWSTGGISVPAGTAGFLAPCVSDDQLSHLGPSTISYTSAPFTSPEAVAGPITATMFASSTTPETELVAELEDVTPSGASYPLTEGALLGSLRAVDPSRSWTADGMTLMPYHPYTQASARPVPTGAVTEYQIEIFPTLATTGAGDRLRLTLSTADTPHLTPRPEQLPELAGGVYTVSRSAATPSSLTVELLK
jgi:predicted acyl esterase